MNHNNIIDTWITWDGRIIKFDDIDHQHMSNIYYFMKYIHPKSYEKKLIEFVYGTIIEKFGKLLKYKPDPLFLMEKIHLYTLGYLHENKIIVDGEEIGEYKQIFIENENKNN